MGLKFKEQHHHLIVTRVTLTEAMFMFDDMSVRKYPNMKKNNANHTSKVSINFVLWSHLLNRCSATLFEPLDIIETAFRVFDMYTIFDLSRKQLVVYCEILDSRNMT